MRTAGPSPTGPASLDPRHTRRGSTPTARSGTGPNRGGTGAGPMRWGVDAGVRAVDAVILSLGLALREPQSIPGGLRPPKCNRMKLTKAGRETRRPVHTVGARSGARSGSGSRTVEFTSSGSRSSPPLEQQVTHQPRPNPHRHSIRHSCPSPRCPQPAWQPETPSVPLDRRQRRAQSSHHGHEPPEQRWQRRQRRFSRSGRPLPGPEVSGPAQRAPARTDGGRSLPSRQDLWALLGRHVLRRRRNGTQQQHGPRPFCHVRRAFP